MAVFETSDTYLIIQAANRRELKEIELLLLSRSIPFSVEGGASNRFFIPLHYHAFALSELKQFQRENKNWPPVLAAHKGALFRFSPVHLGMVAALVLFHWWSVRLPGKLTESGMLAVEKVLAGEWHRTVTALTLHVDGTHLLANTLGLLIFVGGVHQFTGTGMSWLLVLLSGAVGNFGTALFYQSAHNAVGASTAVFGAVGLMGAFGVRRYLVHKVFSRRFFVPLVGALGLFAMLGTNPESDVMAHIFGLISGVLIGIMLMPLPGSRILKSSLFQSGALVLTLAAVWWCWQTQLIQNGLAG